MALLDCRDTRISLWQGQDVAHSPGFVLLDGGEYQFGETARAQARRRPRDSSSRFWWQLSTQTLQPALGAARHTADLVHSHLRHVHQAGGAPDSLTLAVPDSMPREQLSLLLGIAQACDFAVAGLVSRSVLLASTHMRDAEQSRVLHLEAQLNQTILNELTLEDGEVRLLRSTPLPACGLLALQERCVSAIANAFIQQTRFDPRRSGATEQELYNELPQILATLRERGETSVDMDGHRCRISSEALAGASERLLTGLASARNDLPLLLDPEFVSLPGLDALTGNVQMLADDALWQAWQRQQDQVEIPGEDVHLVDRLTLRADGATAPVATTLPTAPEESPMGAPPAPNAHPAPEVATHVLLGTQALPLRGSEVSLGGVYMLKRQGEHWVLQGDGALVNGLPASPAQPLMLGDTLSLGAAGHGRLIEVLD